MNRNCRGCSAQTVNHSAFGKAEIWFALIAVNSTLVMKNRKMGFCKRYLDLLRVPLTEAGSFFSRFFKVLRKAV
ncbi:hypothetical protein DC852_06255 [Vibrio parahaemolyticus]|nr:hypothetical protein Vc3S01_p20224 [Vibrio campbellii]EGR3502841.1 hypothetical protein [Vibrio parahaemolyticus]KPM92225.1 hypothetical protein AOR10_13585 [Vibrio alginolyticus]OOH98720.1 hypothetical protein BIW16_18630 [Vibrio sp. OULL4]